MGKPADRGGAATGRGALGAAVGDGARRAGGSTPAERHGVEIVALAADDGAGVAADGLRVPWALPGDTVTATVEHVSPHGRGAWGRLLRVEAPSPDRVPPACAAFGRCGGCALQHWRYDAQLAWKRERLAAALGVAVAPCVPSPLTLGWRNKAKLVFGRDAAGEVVLGAYAPRSHAVVDLAGCRVVEPPIDEVARALARLAGELDVPIYDEASGDGCLRYAILRASADGHALVVLVSARPDERLPELARRVRRAAPSVVGVVANLQPARGNALLGDAAPDVLLDGAGALDDVVAGVALRLDARAFFQVNRGTAELVYAAVAREAAVTSGDDVVELYAGVGAMSLALARRARSVVAVEREPAAVAAGGEASARAGIGCVRFVTADAADWLAQPDARADVLVVDPPRKGLAPSVLDGVARLAPRTIAYVSCAPETLARDVGVLGRAGYALATALPFDMHPHTPHVEALAVLRRTR